MAMPRKLRCEVAAILTHGDRVFTVDLKPESSAPHFRPGQFLHLTVEAFDPAGFWPESRVFSIASSPRDRSRLRICYSVKGRYTAKMEALLRVGSVVWVKLPYGDFVVDESRDAVLLAGGTGISAFSAFLEALTPDHAREVRLAYGARKPDLLLFRAMIEAQLERVPRFRALFFAEAGLPDPTPTPGLADSPATPVWLPGPISLAEVNSRTPVSVNPVYYLSGPPVMLRSLTEQLRAVGVPPDRIRNDAWE